MPLHDAQDTLTISALYLGILGLGFMLAPRQLGIDVVPPDASPALLAYLRVFGGPMVGIGVLNWLARNAEPSTARDAIVLANLVGVCLRDVNGHMGGYSAVTRVPQQSCSCRFISL